MNIYDFFNSRDIAEHCRSINYRFSAAEAAFLVWRSNHHTLEEKHTAWQQIIDTMPDIEDCDGCYKSLHETLRSIIKAQNKFIRRFCAKKNNYVFTADYCSI